MRPSLAMKVSVPSSTQALMKYQIMKPTVTYGMNVPIGWPNSCEYSPPSAAAVTAMLMVIHSGPITERR